MSCQNARETGADNEAFEGGFDGLEGWRKFCAEAAPTPPAINWNRPLRQLKRVIPVTFASLLGLAACGGAGGSVGPSIHVALHKKSSRLPDHQCLGSHCRHRHE